MFEREKIDATKMKAHSKQHKSRLEHVKQMNLSKEKLLSQLKHRVPQMNQFEAQRWHKSWNEFSRQARRITSQFSLYEQVINTKNPLTVTEGQKTLLNKYELGHGLTQNNGVNPIPNKTNSRINIANEFLDAKIINDSLLAKPEETYRAIFGEPKKITSREMRYPGGLVISLKGRKSGLWYDFSEGMGGCPLQAIMRERGMDFHEALNEGAILSGGYILNNPHVTRQLKSEKNQIQINEEKNKIRSAKSIVKGGIPIKNTVAERYLKQHRGIEHPERLNVLFWPKGSVWKGIDDNGNLYERINKIPALLIPACNEKNEITGVQRIYLDPKTGKKNSFMETAKLSQGKIENSAGILQRGEKFGRVYLAEGAETGASIAMADPESTVLVSLGLSNLKNLSPLIKRVHPKEVIIAGDNDTLSKNQTLEITHEARKFYENCGFNSHIIMPKLLPGMEKTDWNDVHRVRGIQVVKNELGLTKDKTNNWVINTANSISKQEMKFINNINILPDKSTINVNKSSSLEPKNNINIQQQSKQKNMELEL